MYKKVGSLFSVPYYLLQEKIVARIVKLAQAGMSRLGEVNRGSPKYFCHEWSPRQPTVSFERANVSLTRGGSRLSENACRVLILEVKISPRRRELA